MTEDTTPAPELRDMGGDTRRYRTSAERDRDRAVIARLILEGWTFREIAAEFDGRLSRSQVHRDMEAIGKLWRARAVNDVDTLRKEELARIDHVYRVAFEGWIRSLRPREETSTKTVEADRGRTEAAVKRSERDGNPRFLAVVLSCIDRRAKLLGLDAPTRIDIRELVIEEARGLGLSEAEALAAAEEILRGAR